jgi:DNA primase
MNNTIKKLIIKASNQSLTNDDKIKLQKIITKKTVIICPFHEEKTPSCVIDCHKKRVPCFGCGKGFYYE